MCLPASSSCGFDFSKWCSSCLLPGNRREKIDEVMSEGEPEGDRSRGKRKGRDGGVKRRLLFSSWQAFLPLNQKTTNDVMCCWLQDDYISGKYMSECGFHVKFDTLDNKVSSMMYEKFYQYNCVIYCGFILPFFNWLISLWCYRIHIQYMIHAVLYACTHEHVSAEIMLSDFICFSVVFLH